MGDPTGEAEEALIPSRGKQVPRAEINGQNSQAKKTIYEKRAYLIRGYVKAKAVAQQTNLTEIN